MERQLVINALYKYVKFEAAKAILQNCSLKFSAPGTFNDPFDCDINLLDFNYNDKIHPTFQHEIGLMKKKYAAYPGIQRIKWEDGYKYAQVQKINKSRICCFSLVNSNMLMWSHYADSHNGICFEFDNNAVNKFLKLNNENISYGLVHYGLKERINYLQHEKELGISKLFFTKSEEWVYEKEFRMVSLSAKDFENFYPEFLKGIYFGVTVSPSQKEEIYEICKSEKHTNVSFYQMEKNELNLMFRRIFSH